MKIETEKETRLEKQKGKFVLIKKETFERAQDVYDYFNHLMNVRAKMASEVQNWALAIENNMKYLAEIDEEVKRIEIHLGEIKEVHKKEYEKAKKERDEKLSKGPLAQKPLVNVEVKDSEPTEEKPAETKEEKDGKAGI